MTYTNRHFGRLTAISIAIAIAGLTAAYIGIQGARNLILSQISTNSADQWAEILSFSVADPNLSDGINFESVRVEERVNLAISDGLILWYGVFNTDGQLAASSSGIPFTSLTSTELDTLRREESVSRSNVARPTGVPSPTTAEAFLAFHAGEDLLGYVGVRVSRAEAGPLLNRFLDIAFVGLCFLVLMVGGIGILLLRRYIYNQSELERRLSRATEDLMRSEAVANVGHWSQESVDGPSQWSDELFVICGQDPETFVPTNDAVLSCILPEDRPRFQDQITRMIEGSEDFELEARIQRPDGSVRHILMRGGVERDDHGNVRRRFGVTQDITDRKEATLALSRNEDMPDRAIEATGAAIWDWDIIEDQLVTTPQMPEMPEMLGYTQEEWRPSIALHIDLCHPDDLERMQQVFQDHLKGKAPYDIEYRMRRADGTYTWIHSRGRAVKDEHGFATRMVGSVTNVSQRREEQELLRKNQETLELAIKAAEAGFFDREWDQNEIYWSPRLKEILGITDETFVPTTESFNALLHPDDQESLRQNVLSFQESEENLETECRVKHADGRWIWVLIRAELQKNENGEPVRSVGFIIDITERREEMERQRRSEETLELAMQAAGAGFFYRQWDEVTHKLSPRLKEILGITDPNFEPDLQTFAALVHPDDQETFKKDTTAYRNLEGGLATECRVKHGDGRWIWIQLRANAQRDEDGNPVRSVGFIIDITDQKTTAIEIERSKEKLELALEASQAGYFNHSWTDRTVE